MIQSCGEVPQRMKIPKYWNKGEKASYDNSTGHVPKSSQQEKLAADSSNSMGKVKIIMLSKKARQSSKYGFL
jgi:hypothetical protein